MLFNSYIFIFIFFPIVAVLYFLLRKKGAGNGALWFLLASSCVFCARYNVVYLVFMLAELLLSFYAAKAIRKSSRHSKLIFVSTLTVIIAVLFVFKYLDTMITGINTLSGLTLPTVGLTLPLGISFYSFSNIMYLVDSYRSSCVNDQGVDIPDTDYTLAEFATYVSYFPKLVQGPIVHHESVISQFRDEEKWKVSWPNLCKGLYRFSLGLFKKVMVADKLALLAGYGYDHVQDLNGADAVITVLAYSLQIYFDFSGYCDMAIGVSKMLNIDLPENFNSPYKSVSISDFWDRWHITLTKFFTKYLYIPLGGSRKGKIRTLINVLIVFLISGLWHGNNMTFILWGVLHGALMIIERIVRECTGRKEPVKNPVLRVFFTLLTFIEVSVLWSLFRADSIAQFTKLWSRVINLRNYMTGPSAGMADALSEMVEMNLLMKIIPVSLVSAGIWVIIIIAVCLIVCFFARNSAAVTAKFKPDFLHMAVTAVLMIWSVMSLSGVTQFIYSNF